MKKKNVVIIAAGGAGKRFGHKRGKQYLKILGCPALYYPLWAFEKNRLIDEIIVVTGPANFKILKALIKKYHFNKVKRIVAAGPERYFSVKNGLKVLPKDAEIVLIHDGSRILVSQKIINLVIKAALKYGAAVPAVPPADTVKEVTSQALVKKTLPRPNLRMIQTPQAFRAEIIKKAYQKIPPAPFLTDDAALAEKLGYPVKVVPGDLKNIKLTYREDLCYIENLLKKGFKK